MWPLRKEVKHDLVGIAFVDPDDCRIIYCILGVLHPGFPQMAQNVPQTQNSNLTWVQGEAAAKAYPVASGQSVLLMDSEDSVMYIKSTDTSGMPLPLRIFDYKERNISGTNRGQSGDKSGTTDFVSRSEFDAFKHEITESINGIRGASENAEG